MIAPARTAAFAALRDINSGRMDLPSALAAVRPTLTDERDRGLAADLVIGTLRWQRQLDWLIAEFSKRPVTKLDFEVLQILRLGAYQLLHLDRVPAAAAVNDAVAMTRRARKTSAAGLVNAVFGPSREIHIGCLCRPGLRRAIRSPIWRWRSRILSGSPGDGSTRYGFDGAEAWETFNNSAAPLMLRVNRLKTNRGDLEASLREHGVEVEPARYAPDGLLVRSGNPLRTPLAGTGLFFVQDEASQLVALLGAVEPGMRVLDTCASPGGKTTAMAAMADDQGADRRG